MTINDVIHNLLPKYSKHGVTEQDIINLLSILDVPIERAYQILRLSMADLFNEEELITTEDMSVITGESVEDLNLLIEQYRAELSAVGEDPDEYFKPIEKQTYFVKGV